MKNSQIEKIASDSLKKMYESEANSPESKIKFESLAAESLSSLTTRYETEIKNLESVIHQSSIKAETEMKELK